MAAVGGKMRLDMGHLDGGAHETKRKSPGSMNEFFRNIRTEKTDWDTILRKKGDYLPVSTGRDRFEFFQYFQERSFFIH
jgi:hypothetical protein